MTALACQRSSIALPFHVLGTVLLSVLAGHCRYAHMTTLRCDPVNPPLLGMEGVASEDAVRRVPAWHGSRRISITPRARC
jgi:hypothetical protein